MPRREGDRKFFHLPAILVPGVQPSLAVFNMVLGLAGHRAAHLAVSFRGSGDCREILQLVALGDGFLQSAASSTTGPQHGDGLSWLKVFRQLGSGADPFQVTCGAVIESLSIGGCSPHDGQQAANRLVENKLAKC